MKNPWERPRRSLQPKGWLQSMGGATPSAGSCAGAGGGGGGGGGGSLKVSATAAAISAPLSGTVAGTRSRSSSVGARGSFRTGFESEGSSPFDGAVAFCLASQSLTRRFMSRFGISGRDPWLRTPPITIAHSLQSGLLVPDGYSRQSSQNSRPQRRQTLSARSKLWSWQRPVRSAITGHSPRGLFVPSAATPHFLMSRTTSERVTP